MTQGSDTDWKLVQLLGRYAEAYVSATGEDLPAILTEVEEHIQADKQRSIDRAVAEARIDELNQVKATFYRDGMHIESKTWVADRIAELEQQLSPTTTEEKEMK